MEDSEEDPSSDPGAGGGGNGDDGPEGGGLGMSDEEGPGTPNQDIHGDGHVQGAAMPPHSDGHQGGMQGHPHEGDGDRGEGPQHRYGNVSASVDQMEEEPNGELAQSNIWPLGMLHCTTPDVELYLKLHYDPDGVASPRPDEEDIPPGVWQKGPNAGPSFPNFGIGDLFSDDESGATQLCHPNPNPYFDLVPKRSSHPNLKQWCRW